MEGDTPRQARDVELAIPPSYTEVSIVPPPYATVQHVPPEVRRSRSDSFNRACAEEEEDVTHVSHKPTPSTDAPPSYDSLFGRVRKVKDESGSNVEFATKVFGMAFCGPACCAIWIAFLLALPVASIVIGSLYLGQCPREHFIPIYVLVSGCFGVVKAFSNIGQQIKTKIDMKKAQRDPEAETNQAPQKQKPNPVDSVLNCFLFGWFIAGSVWVYRVHGDYQSEDPSLPNYCHQTVFLFAFWTITIQYIMIPLICVCCCAVMGVVACVACKSSDDDD